MTLNNNDGKSYALLFNYSSIKLQFFTSNPAITIRQKGTNFLFEGDEFLKKREPCPRCEAREKVPKAEEKLLKLVNHIAKTQEHETVVNIKFVDFKRQKPHIGTLYICVLSSNQAVIVLDVEERGDTHGS